MVKVQAAVIEAELALLEVEQEGVAVDAAEVGQVAVGEAPEALVPLMWLPRTLRLENSPREWSIRRCLLCPMSTTTS
jgi:hypothetical protein